MPMRVMLPSERHRCEHNVARRWAIVNVSDWRTYGGCDTVAFIEVTEACE